MIKNINSFNFILFSCFLLLGICESICASESNQIKSFSQAKKAISVIYKNNKTTFYCGCTYNNKKRIDLNSCNYIPRKNKKRAKRLEWEHVVPAYHFGNARACWREKLCTKKNGKKYKGRRCCKKIDPIFKQMEADLHNLVPAIGEVNGDRSNFKFTMIEGEQRRYGNCDVEIDFKAKDIEPKPDIRGNIARTYFYMNKRYKMPISKKQRKLFDIWNKLDTVDNWERKRNKLIESVQGNRNSFID